jgi:hypothetical protein
MSGHSGFGVGIVMPRQTTPHEEDKLKHWIEEDF